MAEKRYYWLKLKDDFFKQPKIKKLRRIAGGDTYTIIYLKMQLLSLKNKGVIVYEGIEDTFEEELALHLDEEIDDIRLTLAYLKSQDLLCEQESEFMLYEATNNIGSEVESAERVRRFREKTKLALQCNGDVTKCNESSISISNSISNSKVISNSNIKEKETNKEINNINIYNTYKEIIDFLNEKTNSKYKYTTKATQRLINARLNEKFTVDDFKIVIAKKAREWGKDPVMHIYLRPETLFSASHFESYLNEKEKPIHSEQSEHEKRKNQFADIIKKNRERVE